MNTNAQPAATEDIYDLLVVGGGINGVGIARDAVGRGLKVALCEKSDLASGTSSASTKLIHGGLRYLEYGEFRLVQQALREREVLLNMAPHIIWPLRFVLPHLPGMRPAWLLRLGLFIYDHLGGREKLPGCSRIDLGHHAAGKPLSDRMRVAFEYSDCWADDSRLVVLNALDAAERGANILTRTTFVSADRGDEAWTANLRRSGGENLTIRARSLVNAAGPWVAKVADCVEGVEPAQEVRLVKGSHLVTRRLFDGNRAYIFQNDDKRIAFAIPFERDFTLIGTTDISHEDSLEGVSITADETGYLIRLVNQYLRSPISESDILWSYSGVRPLLEEEGKNASETSRDYLLELDKQSGCAPLLTVYGGKLTAYRTLAEQALEKLLPALDRNAPAWTAQSTLPGGDIPNADFASFEKAMQRRWPWLDAAILHRLLRAYGTSVEQIVGSAEKSEDLGEQFGAGLSAAEVNYLVGYEFAMTADDVLWRRSKLGLRLDDSQRDALRHRFSVVPKSSRLPMPATSRSAVRL